MRVDDVFVRMAAAPARAACRDECANTRFGVRVDRTDGIDDATVWFDDAEVVEEGEVAGGGAQDVLTFPIDGACRIGDERGSHGGERLLRVAKGPRVHDRRLPRHLERGAGGVGDFVGPPRARGQDDEHRRRYRGDEHRQDQSRAQAADENAHQCCVWLTDLAVDYASLRPSTMECDDEMPETGRSVDGVGIRRVWGREGTAAGPQSIHRPLILGYHQESDNVCYVNL